MEETHQPHPAARLLLPLVMGAAVFGLYVNTLVGFDYDIMRPYFRQHVMIDDVLMVMEKNDLHADGPGAKASNPTVTHPYGYEKVWRQDYWAGRTADANLYRPVTVLSYWMNAFVTGLTPVPMLFRLVNVLLLWLLGVLTAWWLGRYMEHPAGAWFAAFLLIAHPANTELINHIVGRADILAMIGVVGFALAQRRAQMKRRWSPALIVAGLLAAALAVGSKETGLLVIPVALVQGFLVRTTHKRGDPEKRWRVRAVSLALVAIPAIVYLAARASVVGGAGGYGQLWADDLTGNPLRDLPLLERLPAVFAIVWHYTAQIFATDTAFLHNPVDVPTWSSPDALAGMCLALGYLAFAAFTLKRKHWLSVPIVLATGQFLLVGNLLMPIGVYAANRLMLPFIICAVAVVAHFIARTTNGSRRAHAAALIPVTAVLLVMGTVTFDVNTKWYTIQDLTKHDTEIHVNHPAAMYLRGRADAEIAARPGATIDARSKALDNAIKWVGRAVEERPDSIQARLLLAELLLATGRYDAAFGHYFDIVHEQNDNHLESLIQLSVLEMIDGRIPESAQYLHRAHKIAPHDARVMHNRALLSLAQGNVPQAIQRFNELLEQFPRHAEAKRQRDALRDQQLELVEQQAQHARWIEQQARTRWRASKTQNDDTDDAGDPTKLDPPIVGPRDE